MKINCETKYVDNGIIKIAHIQDSDTKDIYFKFPLSVRDFLTDRDDPFVFALLHIMMQHGGEIEFDGTVSRSVAKNVNKFSRLWHVWKPNLFKEIHIKANIADDVFRNDNNKLIVAFSGGLDAAYTAYKYAKDLDTVQHFKLEKAVMVLGADIPLDERNQFEIACTAAKRMTDDLGIDLVCVETNIREFLKSWSYSFASVICGCLSFFQKEYFYGCMASDDTVKFYQIPWGSNPISDPYLTSDSFRFFVDGYEHSRTERAAVIRNWKVGVENLRVCWSNEDKSKNCGKCEKCVRTKLNFLAVGIKHLPSMPNDITTEEILQPKLIRDKHNILYFRDIYDYAKKHNSLSPEWINLLGRQVEQWSAVKYTRKYGTVKSLLKKCLYKIKG